MPSSLVAKRPTYSGRELRSRLRCDRLNSGRVVGSLVLSVILFVLIPTWLLGNLFIAVFPPSNSATTSNPSKLNTTSQTSLNSQLSSATPTSPPAVGEATNNEVKAMVVAEEPKSVSPDRVSPNVAANSPSDVSGEAPTKQREPEFRLWTNSAGKTVEAKFVRFVGDKIELITIAGKPAVVSPSIFSAEDQEYLKQLHSQQ